MNKNTLLAAIEKHDAKFIDLRFTDTIGKEQHITIPVSAVDDDFIENGKIFLFGKFLEIFQNLNDHLPIVFSQIIRFLHPPHPRVKNLLFNLPMS